MKENIQEKSPIKQRILQYLSFKRISQYKCYNKTGMTRGVLAQNNGISEDNLTKFLLHYDDINLDWLLLGKGEMLRNVVTSVPYKPDNTEKIAADDSINYQQKESFYLKLYKDKDEETGKLKEEIGALKERIRQLQNESYSATT